MLFPGFIPGRAFALFACCATSTGIFLSTEDIERKRPLRMALDETIKGILTTAEMTHLFLY